MSEEIRTDQPTDEEALEAIADGNVNAFEVLVRRYGDAVFRIVGKRIPPNDIEDVAQQVFLSAFRSLHTYRGRQPFDHWLARIARRRCCDYWRQIGALRKHEDGSQVSREDGHTAAEYRIALRKFDDANRRHETTERVHAALDRLSPEDRRLMEFIYFDELPLKAVADAFGWSLVNVKVKAHRLRKRLESILKTKEHV